VSLTEVTACGRHFNEIKYFFLGCIE